MAKNKKSKPTGGSAPAPSTPKYETLAKIEPMTNAQKRVFTAFKKGNNILLSGSAGTGKTFLGMYLALEEILQGESPRDKMIIVRSIVPTRDIGFLPGSREEKEATYLYPYIGVCAELFGDKLAWNKLVALGKAEFLTTSFVRGITVRNATVIIDEMQNLTFHELDSIITRLGENCRIILCGDYHQSDLRNTKEKTGLFEFIRITERMKYFSHVKFSWEDIVRSGLVRDYIMTKEMMKLEDPE